MSVTRGDFLKQLGRSLPGMVLGSGAAAAAQKIIGKMAAASGAMEGSPAPATLHTPAPAPAEIPFIKHGPRSANRVALTFDDGPTPGVTDLILDELKRRGMHATFFMIGRHVAAAPDLARRVLAEGHEVASHTWSHPKLTTLPDAEVVLEIEKTQQIFAEILGTNAAWFRPPYGELRQNQAPLFAAKGLGIILWDVDPADWSQPGVDKIIGTILAKAQAGSIVVCHDSHAQTAQALPAVIDGLIEKGLVSSTVSQLLNGIVG